MLGIFVIVLLTLQGGITASKWTSYHLSASKRDAPGAAAQ